MKNLNRLIVIVFFLVSSLFLSCNKEEPIPSYIHIDKFTLSTNYVDEGSASHKIVDAWLYVDDQLVGVYEMPFTIPVLFEGSHIVKVLPGVKENGITETRIPYLFYNTFEQTIVLTPGKITIINPTTTYSDGADFSWLGDFEGSGTGICDNLGATDTVLQLVTAPPTDVFELTGSGGVVLGSGQSTYFGLTCNKYTLPKGGAPVFLELNYKCNTDFNVGLIGYAGSNIEYQGISITLRATNGWNKIYINLSNEVTTATTSTQFAVFFSMLNNTSLSSSYFYIDNAKLIN